MNFLKVAVVIVGILVFFVAADHQHAFGREWIEDHAQSEGFLRRGRLSTTAIFSGHFRIGVVGVVESY
jgi:hypothetical protein